MKTFNWRIPVGIVVVLFGVLGLLQTVGGVEFQGTIWLLVFGGIFAAVGAVFLYALAVNREQNWWAAIPGCTLAGLGVMMGLFTIPGVEKNLNYLPPFIFMLSISAAFFLVYFTIRQWWAIIPGGALASVALVVLVSEFNGELAGGILFLGLAATFSALALLGVGKGAGLAWPWYPAAALFLMGGIIFLGSGQLMGVAWSILLIAAGAFLVLRPALKK
jgi:hypothetical protein